jgi:sulfate adenylyltransferase
VASSTSSFGAGTPPRGVCLWFTGLSGSGKTTTARVVAEMLAARGWTVTMLDGDVVRTHLSKELGFSRADRDENVRRVAFVAGEVVRHGGISICALVSPYRAARAEARSIVEAAAGDGAFVEVFVDTPLEVCAERDVKGLYAGAERGEVAALTGVADPYEPPLGPELRLETVGVAVEDNARRVIDHLVAGGFLGEAAAAR